MNKKFLLSMGGLLAMATPIVAVISCAEEEDANAAQTEADKFEATYTSSKDATALAEAIKTLSVEEADIDAGTEITGESDSGDVLLGITPPEGLATDATVTYWTTANIAFADLSTLDSIEVKVKVEAADGSKGEKTITVNAMDPATTLSFTVGTLADVALNGEATDIAATVDVTNAATVAKANVEGMITAKNGLGADVPLTATWVPELTETNLDTEAATEAKYVVTFASADYSDYSFTLTINILGAAA